MRVLVTGGAGYVGSHVCKALALAGIEPVVFDNLANGHRRSVKWGPFEEGDIRDKERLDAVLRQYRPNGVLHFAGLIEVGESVRDPARFYDVNVQGSLSLLDAMRKGDIGAIVFSSSCAVYGEPQKLPLEEDHPFRPASPYGWTKLIVERVLADFDTAYGLRHMALRYFNASGADPQGEIGECHDPESHIIPLLIQTALGRREQFRIFGTDYDTPDGTAIRDYVHVTDLAQVHVAAMRALINGAPSSALNVGTGRGYSVKEIVGAVEKAAGHRLPVVEAARRPGDPAVLVADAERAKRLFGWSPQHSSLEEIIATAWRWHSAESARPSE